MHEEIVKVELLYTNAGEHAAHSMASVQDHNGGKWHQTK